MLRLVVVRDRFLNVVYEDIIDYNSEEDLEDIYACADKLDCTVSLVGGI